jgi:hypothetical protein
MKEKHRQRAKFSTYSMCNNEIRRQEQGQETRELILGVHPETSMSGTQTRNITITCRNNKMKMTKRKHRNLKNFYNY